MKLTGFADEAAPDLATQIKATQELGWQYISARGIDGKNMHDLSDSEFDTARGQLEDAGIRIAEFGSLIGSWSKNIKSDFALTLDEVDRAIPRMQQLGTNIVRVMSYAQQPWGERPARTGTLPPPARNHHTLQRRRPDHRSRELHELGWLLQCPHPAPDRGSARAETHLRHRQPVSSDRSIPEPQRTTAGIASSTAAEGSQGKPTPPWQDAWQFYQAVREHIIHIHIKDCRNPLNDEVEPEYVFPGEGQAYIPAIIDDLKQSTTKDSSPSSRTSPPCSTPRLMMSTGTSATAVTLNTDANSTVSSTTTNKNQPIIITNMKLRLLLTLAASLGISHAHDCNTLETLQTGSNEEATATVNEQLLLDKVDFAKLKKHGFTPLIGNNLDDWKIHNDKPEVKFTLKDGVISGACENSQRQLLPLHE